MNEVARLALLLLALLGCSDLLAQPRWVTHVSMPGSDLPAAGLSRFDQLFLTQDNRYQIPYPFANLITYLEARIDNGDKSGVRQVFVPIGRSLQRNAPAPDFFKYPRALIALQGEPADKLHNNAEVLEYRLFIAHQPGSESLEVISYNDKAGRFEFQLVENYNADERPGVRQANRLMCLSCHQNMAPIFATRPWSETTFNVNIANRLVAALPQQFNSLIGTVTADADAIDLLVERANYLAVAQLIWQQGCGNARCRAAILRALLQYRLSGKSGFSHRHPAYREDYFAELERNWELKWPDGLALSNGRIADRDPFADSALKATQDPLSLRPPHATWRVLDSILADGIIYRLAGFLTAVDTRRIDRYLITTSQRQPVRVDSYTSACRLQSHDISSAIIACSGNNDASTMQARFEIELAGEKPVALRIDSLRLPGDASLLQPDIVDIVQAGGWLEAEPTNSHQGLSQRLASGDRVSALKLYWQESMLTGISRIEVQVSRDFELLEQALSHLLLDHRQGSRDSLDSKPFRREAILRDLGQALGWVSDNNSVDDRLSARVIGAGNNPPGVSRDHGPGGRLALLQPYCGRCHAENTANPPGFLAGADFDERIRQCAPRILARLRAWHDNSEFAKAPMPPPATLNAMSTTIDAWPRSDHYRTLLAAVENLLAKGNHGLTPQELEGMAYDSFPPCLQAES
jgi:hypothetical protein